MPNHNPNCCMWCHSSLSDGYNHSLCKAWQIFLIKEWIDKTEDTLVFMYNFVDLLEELPQ